MTSSMGAVTGTQTGAAGRIRLFPWAPGADLVVDQMAINVHDRGYPGRGQDRGLSADANGRPDQLILETGDLDLGTLGPQHRGRTDLARRADLLVRAAAFLHRHRLVWSTSGTADINAGHPSPRAQDPAAHDCLCTPAPATWGFRCQRDQRQRATAIWLRMA